MACYGSDCHLQFFAIGLTIEPFRWNDALDAPENAGELSEDALLLETLSRLAAFETATAEGQVSPQKPLQPCSRALAARAAMS